ncbi:ribosome-associated translation inhibitor RaiA [Lujinxingia litoralis]|uniref:Ribosome-associated translation inhibitor RaiA n=1 Tax=Lujinxingia litoralis TaxID=2211119 RepID=A0A328CAX8_9DELT|nr:ribosome-associated translation inhibitor RaiA [Lujinxingia litoralis]RAL22367.1 ribosome-associated translation inhibitor RaiA [Lujinxingia litoralis]
MNANVSFRNMDSSASLRNYATAKLERICDKYVQGKIDASVVMTVEKFWHIADFTLQIKNLTVKGAERSEDMYSSIDLALDKIEKQLRRHKDRLRDHKPTAGQAKMFKMAVVAPIAAEAGAEVDSEFAEDYELYPEPAVVEEASPEVETVNTPSGRVTVLRNKLYEAKPMSIDEAVLQLDLLEDRQFFVFTNAETQAINVVYKRDDQNVGVIET